MEQSQVGILIEIERAGWITTRHHPELQVAYNKIYSCRFKTVDPTAFLHLSHNLWMCRQEYIQDPRASVRLAEFVPDNISSPLPHQWGAVCHFDNLLITLIRAPFSSLSLWLSTFKSDKPCRKPKKQVVVTIDQTIFYIITRAKKMHLSNKNSKYTTAKCDHTQLK